jgi:hypothetical protein
VKQLINILLGVISVAIIALVVMPAINGRGSEWQAHRWERRFRGIESTAEAIGKYPVASRQYADGSWIFGIAIGSHGNPVGGTVVTKDSTGRIRVFFGHVCAPAVLSWALREENGASIGQSLSNLVARSTLREQVVE